MENNSSPPDTWLQQSRRLDWRFCLPSPQLKRVAYWGPDDNSLVESLKLFAQDLIRIDSSTPTSIEVDLMVLVNPSVREFRHYLNLVHPTEGFYAEVPRHTRTDPSRIVFPYAYRHAAKQLGFQEMDCFWHYPNFEEPTRIIPVSSATPLVHVMSKGKTDLKTQLKQLVIITASRSGILARITPYTSVMGWR